MITLEGCKARRQQLLQKLKPSSAIVIADPVHLRYFANADVDPMNISADYGAILIINPDSTTKLFHDHRAPKSLEKAFVDERTPLSWYAGETPGQGPRRLVLKPIVSQFGGRIHDCICDPDSEQFHTITAELRRSKHPDEIAMIRHCCNIAKAGFDWAYANIKAGMTEIDVYTNVFSAVTQASGQANVVYGDFAVSPGMSRKGGPPTSQVLKDGDMFILDYSVIIRGYRSDYTNTFVVGGKPTAEQKNLYDLCLAAMKAGELKLKANVKCQTVYDAVMAVFEQAGMAKNFPHHAGHGLGLGHPEAPFFVRKSTETLVAGDVMTLEPGLYVDGIGGIRIEHNYEITESGYNKLTSHEIKLA